MVPTSRHVTFRGPRFEVDLENPLLHSIPGNSWSQTNNHKHLLKKAGRVGRSREESGGVGKSPEELGRVGKSREEPGGVGRSREESGRVWRSWEESGRVGKSREESRESC